MQDSQSDYSADPRAMQYSQSDYSADPRVVQYCQAILGKTVKCNMQSPYMIRMGHLNVFPGGNI